MNKLNLLLLPTFLGIAIISGQLIRLPSIMPNGLLFLDLFILCLVIYGAFSLHFKFSKPPLWIIFGLIFFLIGLFSLILTPLHLNLSDYLSSALYDVRFLLYLFLGLEIYSGAFPAITNKLSAIFIWSGLLLSILGLLQLIFIPDLQFLETSGWDPHFFRTVSTFLDPNFLGSFLILTMLISFVKIKNHFQFKLPLISFIFCYFAILTTFSRSTMLMFLVSFIFLAVFKKSIKLFIITLILTTGLFLSYQAYDEYIAKPRQINRQQSASFRVNSWQTGIKMWQNSPILGVGFNSYRFALEEYKLAPDFVIQGHAGNSNDASLLFVMATTGIIGLIFYILFLTTLIYKSINKPILIAGIGGLLINSIFINSLFYSWPFLWIMLIASTKSDELNS